MKEILKRYGGYKAESMAGGFTNATYCLQGGGQKLVAKIANLSNSDIENEKLVLSFLKDKDFTPQVVDSFQDSGTQVLVTKFAGGQNGQAVLDAGNRERAEILFTKMGLCLARSIHSYAYDGNLYGMRAGRNGPLQFNMSFLPESLADSCNAAVSGFHFRREEWVLTHGDFGAHNLLIDDSDQLTVMDWEWAEWFHPLVDLAWACWNTQLHYPGIADTLLPAFLEAYQSIKPVSFSADTMKICVLYKLHTLLSRMEYADEEAQKKWTHRLKWALESDFSQDLNSE